MRRYQTQEQVALNFLLSEAKEELRLCEERIEYHAKHREYVLMRMEKEIEAKANAKIEKLSSLLEMERESWANSPSLLQIGIVNTKGESVIQEERFSEEIE
ncbi:hypothetical protein [Bacillus velezensis]|uniref:hypothetical protein n=1 Tax=Bacillus velezensis TaxID=492670 RepID=UPI0005EB9AB4|nr:hypothetical protein [Bacillus velezensis]KJR69257.1 hypothetical protein BAGR45_10400 [Bacillus velezensis]